jgi:hypothetical protein
MIRRLVLVAAICAAAVCAAPADTRPDFSGDWKINVDKSNFGPMPAPATMTRTIVQKDNEMTIHSTQTGDQGDMTNDMKLSTDGKESVNTLKTPNGDIQIKTTAMWDGPALSSKSKFEIQGMEISSSEKWTMGTDGKSMTIAQVINTPQGDFELSYVFDKAAAGTK